MRLSTRQNEKERVSLNYFVKIKHIPGRSIYHLTNHLSKCAM